MSRSRRSWLAFAGSATLCVELLGAAVAPSSSAGVRGTSAAKPRSAAIQNCGPIQRFDRHRFPRHPRIDNRWLPLAPGMRSVLSGTVRGDDGKLHAHRIVSTVSGVTKVLNGVRTLVVFERDYQDGKLQDSELAFEAQDVRGYVWNVGEYPEEYENGRLAGAPSTWIAGIAGARAGIGMLAHPHVGAPAYLQGMAPSVDFRDCARVASKRHGLLAVDEWAPLDPEGGHQLKYYTRGIGPVRVGALGGTNPEVLRLTARVRLDRAALRRVNTAVMKQDRRGYRVSRDVYARTAPARRWRDC